MMGHAMKRPIAVYFFAVSNCCRRCAAKDGGGLAWGVVVDILLKYETYFWGNLMMLIH